MSETYGTADVCLLDAQPNNPSEAPGILLVSASLEVTSMNAKASSILQHLLTNETPKNVTGTFPLVIQSLCRALLNSLPPEPRHADWHRLHLIHVIEGPHYSFLFHGIGIPEMFARCEGRLLIILVPLVTQISATQGKSIDRITLTPRETHVAQYLADGLTNKEIGNKLGLSEHTVKDHVKRLMRKTHTTTRTAVVSQLITLHKLTLVSGYRRSGANDETPLKHIA